MVKRGKSIPFFSRNSGSEDVEILSHHELQLDMTPVPILTIQGSTAYEPGLMRELSISPSKRVSSSTTAAHFECRLMTLSHKQKAIHLFAFASVLRLNHKANILLWEHSRLHHSLGQQLHNKTTCFATLPDLTALEGLELAPVVQLYLHQAGFKIETSTEQQRISDLDLKQIIKQSGLASSHSVEKTNTQQNLKKVA